MIAAEIQSYSYSSRRIGNIPIRNLWLLMLYASDICRYLGAKKVAAEDNPEDIADLVAELLCHEIEKRLKRNLSYGYEAKVAVMSRVRGRINVLTTESRCLLEKGKVCCRFDELTIDTPRNRYVRSALASLMKLDIKPTLAHRCKGLIRSFERLGVSKVKPINYSLRSERFGRHDIGDQKMVVAADLAFSLALPTEFAGQYNLMSPDTQQEWLRKLFEKAMAGFYEVTLDKSQWQVSAGERLHWQVLDKSSIIDAILPQMQTDIIIRNEVSGQRLVIDTKFNSVTTKSLYREASLRSNYIYQMYAYLRSQEKIDDHNSLTSTGMLLHPTVDEDLTEVVNVQGHPIWFCTVNLGESAINIRERLLDLHQIAFADAAT